MDPPLIAAISGDGSLSVIDLRSTKSTPFAHSEDQEDELLSIVSIRRYVPLPHLHLKHCDLFVPIAGQNLWLALK